MPSRLASSTRNCLDAPASPAATQTSHGFSIAPTTPTAEISSGSPRIAHSAKNGWTGDACLACETGLYSYHAIAPYREFLETLCDAQRPSGQVPVIVPTGGWGYNNRLGPAWDMALFEIPYRMALHSRNAVCLTDFIGPMTRLLEYETSLCTDHIFPFGLGDWCAPANQESRADRRLVSTLYCAEMMRILAFTLKLAHDTQQAESWRKRRNATLNAIRTSFVTDGILGNGTPTEIALALGFGLFKETETWKWAECLAKTGHAAPTRQHQASNSRTSNLKKLHLFAGGSAAPSGETPASPSEKACSQFLSSLGMLKWRPLLLCVVQAAGQYSGLLC